MPPRARGEGLKIRWRVKAPGTVRKKLSELAEAMPRAFAAGLYQEGLALDALANSAKFIPVDTGRMRATHYVAPPTRAGRVVRVVVGYGVAYAIYVHERDDQTHTVGRAHWLLLAFAERARGFYGRLATRTKKNHAAGVGVDSLSASAPTKPADPGPSKSKKTAERKAARKGRSESARAKERLRRRIRSKQRRKDKGK